MHKSFMCAISWDTDNALFALTSESLYFFQTQATVVQDSRM